MSFENYTNCVFEAFKSHPKAIDVINKKKEILASVGEFHNFVPNSILYIGFNPGILSDNTKSKFVTEISKEALEFLHSKKIQCEFIPAAHLNNFYKKFDVVVALDEYFTFAKSDLEQKNTVANICKLAKEYVITTCKDYKNQDFKEREFSTPALIRGNENSIYLEFHDHNVEDRNSWTTKVFGIVGDQLSVHGPYARRFMFFKQLAKFSADAGAVGFTIHKNLMYKSLIKKNYEHVISIQFE